MSVSIHETDFGTKKATLLKIQEMMSKKNAKFDMFIYKFWQSVYYHAVKECPKDTGALTKSIKLRKGGPDGGTSPSSGQFGVAIQSQDYKTEWTITAGGAGVVNPKHKRVVDYAQAVHNGHKRGGKWVAPNPFLTRAFAKANQNLWQMEGEYLDWWTETWKKGAITAPPSEFGANIAVGVSGGKGIYK